MPVWPISLPQSPLADSFRETVADNTIRSQVDQGPAKLRRRATAAVGLISCGFLLDKMESAVLSDFYKTGLSGGVLPFTFRHPRTGGSITCRFKSPPIFAANTGDYFRITLELEIMP